ncbi:biotin-dependent carboxyltransferase [Vibrio sp. T187]|uniref:5-oxoprolinase subunit C family protein n=1 Tax=Vibrio TaxID=662 RepID=UPI0010CA1042|nr:MULTISPECIES: biotin-dependent carboxyltransferase family protein [Vibrio]MBW3696268.1 biotin-dependent carboxyltransferase [Vibrio sp. T187]
MTHPNNVSLTVIKPGQLSLIQDFGRFGLSHLGITQGGPVDDYAYSWANHLLGNSVNQSVIEITLGQVAIRIDHQCELAICGGDLGAKLDDVPIANWSTFSAQKHQILTFGLPKNGLRAYLAVKGGFNVPLTLGSASTVVRDELGGANQGSSLTSDQKLLFNAHSIGATHKPLRLTFRFKPDYNLPLKLRVIESYQCGEFSTDDKSQFYGSEFNVDQHANRMGYRLNGPSITPPSKSMLSEGIALGAIQIPDDGQPIILLNDRQTIGGYPKLGCVARIDLPRLAQAKPGQKVRFVKGDRQGLQDVWCQWANFFGY